MIPRRPLGQTGLDVSVLAIGAGPIPELMTEDNAGTQRDVLARALEHGINWIDTAATYGEGRSETNLGHALATLDVVDRFHLATKVRLSPEQVTRHPIRKIVRESLAGSLERLGVERITLLQLHNSVTPARGDLPTSVTPTDVLEAGGIVEAMRELQSEGLVDHLGITGLGDPESLRQLIGSGHFATMQVPYHLLNPTAGQAAGSDWDETDHGCVINACETSGIGVFAIRVYAGGALLGRPPAKHTHTTKFFPMDLYERDTRRAEELAGQLSSGATVQQAAVRFSLDHQAMSSAIIGFSHPEHIDQAVEALPAR